MQTCRYIVEKDVVTFEMNALAKSVVDLLFEDLAKTPLVVFDKFCDTNAKHISPNNPQGLLNSGHRGNEDEMEGLEGETSSTSGHPEAEGGSAGI